MIKLQSIKDIFRPKDFGKDLKEFGKNFIKVIPIVVIFFGVWWFLDSTVWNDPSERITLTDRGGLVLTESKTFWGGVWFNKDKLIINPTEFTIEKKSIIRGSDTYYIPNSKIKKVIFEEGLNIYKIIIVSEGGILNNRVSFFIIDKDKFETVKYAIFYFCKNQFGREETKTLLNRFSEIIGKGSIN